jgi:excisionase family DNA binding protein
MAEKENTTIFSTFEVAQLIGVDMTTVIGWCKQGKLAAYTTPGKHRRIKAGDLVAFLNEYKMPIPPSLVPERELRCVVVDDEATIRSLVKRALKDMDPSIKVQEASNGFEAGQQIIDTRPHLVVLDLNLPGMDGFKVCQIIRKDDRLKQTKILAISGFDTAETHKKILEAGADVFLPKPFRPQALKEKVVQLLGPSGLFAGAKTKE